MPEPFFPASPDEQPDIATLARLTGLDVMRGIMTGRLPAPPIARLMEMALTEVAEGRCTFEATPGFQHYNPIGSVHGGWYGVVLDSAMGCAVMTTLPRGRAYTTLEYKVNVLRAARHDTGRLICTGRAVHVGRTTATAEARIEDPAGKLYATGTTTCLIMDIAV